jgi:hypothetical protein
MSSTTDFKKGEILFYLDFSNDPHAYIVVGDTGFYLELISIDPELKDKYRRYIQIEPTWVKNKCFNAYNTSNHHTELVRFLQKELIENEQNIKDFLADPIDVPM